MPGSVSNANPSTVLPDGLARQFAASREWLSLRNEYKNGETQVGSVVSSSRKSWQQTRRLVAASLQTLRAFYDARNGAQESFYFYDLITNKTAVYDATGVLTTGRHTVRFDGEWNQTAYMGRSEAPFRLVEVN